MAKNMRLFINSPDHPIRLVNKPKSEAIVDSTSSGLFPTLTMSARVHASNHVSRQTTSETTEYRESRVLQTHRIHLNRVHRIFFLGRELIGAVSERPRLLFQKAHERPWLLPELFAMDVPPELLAIRNSSSSSSSSSPAMRATVDPNASRPPPILGNLTPLTVPPFPLRRLAPSLASILSIPLENLDGR